MRACSEGHYRELQIPMGQVLKFEMSRLAELGMKAGIKPVKSRLKQEALQNMRFWGFGTEGL